MDKTALMAKLNAQMTQGPKKSAIPTRLAQGSGGKAPRRGTFYSNLTDTSAARRVVPITTSRNTDCRIFTALHGRQYEGPTISENDLLGEAQQKIKDSRHRTPIFIDGEGTIYCVDYVPIENYAPNQQQAMENQLFCPQAPVYQSFPRPDNYETYSEYNQSLSQWYSQMQAHLGKIALPNVTGRRYFRPRADLFEGDSENDKSEGASGSAKNSSPTPLKVLDNDEEPDLDLNTWSEGFDPWETTLLPPEPEPEQYVTFEAYEQAMKRWAVLCNKQMRVIPPHPSQLSNLILLRTAIERRNAERERTAQLRKMRPMDVVSDKSEGPTITPQAYKIYNQDPYDVFETKKLPSADYSFAKVDFDRTFHEDEENVLNSVNEAFASISDKVQKLTDTPENNLHHGERTYIPTNRSEFSLLPNSSAMFPREDSTGKLPVVNSTFPLGYPSQGLKPNYELTFRATEISQVDSQKLRENLEYRDHASCLINSIQNEGRHDSLYSWYPSTTLTKQTQEKWSFDENNIIESLRRLVLLYEYLDEFQERVSGSKTNKTPLIDSIAPLITKNELFPKLVGIRENLNSHLAQSKLAYLVGAYLAFRGAEEQFMKIVNSYDVMSLYNTAMILNTFNLAPLDVYPVFPSTLALLSQTIPSEENLTLVKIMISSYYLQVIKSVQKQKFFLEITPQFNNAAQLVETNISSMMQSQLTFMMIDLQKLLNHRCQVISQLFAVLVSHLLSLPSSCTAAEVLGREEICLVESARVMCNSKLSHVRFAGKRLLVNISKHQPTYLREYYKTTPQALVTDLFTTSKDGTEASFLSEFILNFATQEFASMTTKGISAAVVSRYSYLMKGGRKESLFHEIFSRIASAENNLLNQVYLNATKFLVVMTQTYYDLEIIEAYDTVEASERSMSQGRNLLIVPSDINDLFKFLDHPLKEPIVYEIKTNILRCARILSQLSLLFDCIGKQKNFFICLIRFCRDGSDYQFNKEAWKLFYHSFVEHHGFLQQMEASGNLLNQLLESISPGVGNIVITNCLIYICKILQVCDVEAVKIQETGRNSRGDEDIKLIERDVKQFVSVLVKHCLKVHLIFKRLQFNNLNGAPFLSVVMFYHQVHANKSKTTISGSKLYRELTKNKDYKQIVSDSVKLFLANPDLKQSQSNIRGMGTLSRTRTSTSALPSSPFRRE